MQKRIFFLFLHYFFAVRAKAREEGGAKVRTLTLEDRRVIEMPSSLRYEVRKLA